LSLVETIGKALLSWGPPGIFLLAVLDSAGIPIVDAVDVLIVLVAASDADAGYVSAVLALAGSLVGCMFLFHLGRKGGEAYLDKKMQKQPWASSLRRWFHHYGLLTVFIPALVPAPLPLKIFVLSAGAFKIRPLDFFLVVLAARFPRYFGEAYLGSRLGSRPLEFLHENTWELIGVAVGLFVFLLLLIKLKDRCRRLAAEQR